MSKSKKVDILIIGGGHAGAQAAVALRQRGFEGSIALATREPELPYERPPLSKEYLAGEKTADRILIRPPAFWQERHVEMLLGHKAVAVDPEAHEVAFSTGETIHYGTLIWAAGGNPRRLDCPGHDCAGVHYVRSKADVDSMAAALPDVGRVAVIGAGYIGLEAAAVLRKLGKDVVVLEAVDRVLARVAGPPVSAFYEAEHRAQGVEIRTNAAVACIEKNGGRAAGVRLGDGTSIAADLVIVGIGILPAVGPLIAAGASGGNGVDVDEYCRTSLPAIYAVGDCAAHVNGFASGARIRLESVQNANDQATTAAKAIMGAPEPYDAVPWFWSNQYDVRLQTVGISAGYDDLIVRGDPSQRAFSVIYLKDGRAIALDCVNSVKDYVQGRALVLNRTVVPREAADVAVPLKSLVQSPS